VVLCVGEFCAGNCTDYGAQFAQKLIARQPSTGNANFSGKRKCLRANCAQIAKFAKFAKNCVPQGRKFAQKLRVNSKFAKNCDFSRKGEICAKIAPRKIAIFFRD